MRLTVAKYFMGNAKKKVHEVGIVSVYVIENPEFIFLEDSPGCVEALKRVDVQNDPQLKKAVEVLNGRASICLNSE